MKLAIMQPYIFPYIGYFQLINAVDKFIFYDDVNFIKKGWINRNNILLNNKAFLFSVPLQNGSPNKLINEIEISKEHFEKWRNKFYKTIHRAYGKAVNYKDVFNLIQETMGKNLIKISDIAVESINNVCTYLKLDTVFELSSNLYSDSLGIKKAERLIDICLKNRAEEYINPIGGEKLYKKEDFEKEGIKLSFIKSNTIKYKQFNNTQIPNLSIIDVLMFNSIKDIKEILQNYTLI